MKIHVGFDEQQLLKDAKRNGNKAFYIYWEHAETSYPDQSWSDLGEIILSMWISTTIGLARGSSFGSFPFMDGPYELSGKYNREKGIVEFVPRRDSFVWEIPFKELVDELILAANTVLQEYKRLEIEEKESLSKGVALLQTTLSENITKKKFIKSKLATSFVKGKYL